MGVLRPEDRRRADAGGVLQPQLQRVHADLLRQHVEHAFHREGGNRRARCAIRGGLGTVADDIVSDRAGIGDVVGREGAEARVHHRRAGEGAGLELEHPVGGNELAILGDADLHPHRRPRRRAGGAEHLLPAHRQAHREARFLRQHGGNGFQVDDRLAAETAADLGRIDTQVADRHPHQLGGQRTNREMPLAGGPDFALPVRLDPRRAGVRFDIGLVHGGGLELVLDHDIGRGKTRVEVADLEFQPLRDVGGPARRRLDPARDHVGEQQRRIRGHRGIDVDDMRQDFVLHVDQRARRRGNGIADRSHRGDRMTFVQHLLTRHDVARHVPEIHRHPFGADIFEILLREVGRGDHRAHAGQRRGAAGIDGDDAGMGMRGAEDLAHQGAGHLHVGAVHGAAGHLGHAVGAHRAGTDPFEALAGLGDVHLVVHTFSPSLAADILSWQGPARRQEKQARSGAPRAIVRTSPALRERSPCAARRVRARRTTLTRFAARTDLSRERER